MAVKSRLHASLILTYRCNAHCNMCNTWQEKYKAADEIGPEVYRKLPEMFFTNITGGEPFLREDLPDIIQIIRRKTKRIVISTNGYFTRRIIDLCRQFPDLGIRISLEGLPKANDEIRKLRDGFDRSLRTLLSLREMGLKDIGFGMTVQDLNYQDLVFLYELARVLNYEFATATLHNSFYFHKQDNYVTRLEEVSLAFTELIEKLLKSGQIKNWFRAYFNYGLINYLQGKPRLLPCRMGQNGFFLDPSGDVLPCNGMDKAEVLGNLQTQSWAEIWQSSRAREVRTKVQNCRKNCWMIGSAAPAMWENMAKPVAWILKQKIKLLLTGKLSFPN